MSEKRRETIKAYVDPFWVILVSFFSRGVAVKGSQRDKLEGLCRCICRPTVWEKPLVLIQRGDIGYTLKTPYRDGRRT